MSNLSSGIGGMFTSSKCNLSVIATAVSLVVFCFPIFCSLCAYIYLFFPRFSAEEWGVVNLSLLYLHHNTFVCLSLLFPDPIYVDIFGYIHIYFWNVPFFKSHNAIVYQSVFKRLFNTRNKTILHESHKANIIWRNILWRRFTIETKLTLSG